MDISGRIRDLRKKRGLNQFDLSEEVGVSVDTVRRWESNKQIPRADELKNLASILGVTIDELLNGLRDDKMELVISWDWEDMKKGEMNIQNALVDIKTMNDRAFTQWKREGTQKSKPQYVTQLHIYAMGLKELGRTIEHLGIVGVNKNNSEMYIDLFDFDPYREIAIKDYATMVFSEEIEPELGCPIEDWACNYCEYAQICNLHKKPAPITSSKDPLPVPEDDAVIAAMVELRQARELAKEVRDMEAHAKSVLDENVRDKGLRGVQGGGLMFMMTERKSQRSDSTAFKKSHPELLSEFMKESVSMVYEVKEAV